MLIQFGRRVSRWRTMSILKCCLIIIVLAFSLYAQTGKGTITGSVRDQQGGSPLSYVNIMIDGTRLGAASNDAGVFTIRNVPAGTHRVIFQMIGYKTIIVRRVEVTAGATVTVNVELEPRPVEMDVVSVTADREKKMVEQLSPSIRTIRARDVRSMAGGGEDLFRTVQSLPGVAARSDISSQFYVRGGTPDQNLIIVDNVPVFNPYRLKAFGGPISMFNPDVIDYIELLPGGFPAEYGDKLSSVLVVRNKEGDRFNRHASLGASLIDARAFAEGPIPSSGGNGSWLFSARRTYYDQLFNHMDDLAKGTIMPFFRDYQGKLTFDPAPNQKINFNFFDSKEGMDLKDLDVDEGEDNDFFKEEDKFDFKSQINNRLFSVGWTNAINDVTLSELTLSHMNDTWDMAIQSVSEKYNPVIDMRKTEIREDLMRVATPRHTLQTGLTLADYITDITINLHVDSTSYYQDNPDDRRDEDSSMVDRHFRLQNASTTFGLYAQDEYKVVPNIFSILPGVRLDYSTYAGEWVVSPRLSWSYRLLPNTMFRGGWGYYYQSPNFASLFERFEREIEWNLIETVEIKTERAIHYMGGIEWMPAEDYTTKFELYYKDLDHLIVATDSTQNEIPNNSGKGYAWGFETFIQRKPSSTGRYSGWLSYSYSVTKEEDNLKPLHYRDFDQTHSVSLVLNYKLSRHWSLNSQYKYSTGFPWTPIIKDSNGEPQFDEFGNIKEGPVNSKRYPHYERLDVRLSWHKQTARGHNVQAYLEVINVFGRKNIYQYYWSDDHRTRFASYMLPRMPFFGFRYEF